MKFYKIKREHKEVYNSYINTNIKALLLNTRTPKELFLDLCKRRYLGYIVLDNLLNNLPSDAFLEPTILNLRFEEKPHDVRRIPRSSIEVLEEMVLSREYRDLVLYYFNKDINRDDQVIFQSMVKSFAETSHKLFQLIISSLEDGYLDRNLLLMMIKEYTKNDRDLEDVYNLILQKLDLSSDQIMSYPKLQILGPVESRRDAISLISKEDILSKVNEINSITAGLIEDTKLGRLTVFKYGVLLSRINSVLSMFGERTISVEGISSISCIISFDESLEGVPVLLQNGDKIIIPLNNPDKALSLCSKEHLEEVLVVLDIVSNGEHKFDELRTKIITLLSKM